MKKILVLLSAISTLNAVYIELFRNVEFGLYFMHSAITVNVIFALIFLCINSNMFPKEVAPDSIVVSSRLNSTLTNEGKSINDYISKEKIYLDKNLSIFELARKLNIAEYRLRAIIQKEFCYSNFNAFINRYRVEHAHSLLTSELNLPIKNIVFSSGFKSHPPFNKAFRSLYGCSPREYRASYRKHGLVNVK